MASPDRRLHKAAFTRATDTPRAPPDRRLHKAAFTRAAAGAGARGARAAAANLPQAGGSRRAIRGLGLVELDVDGTEHDRQSLEHAQPVLAAPCITHGYHYSEQENSHISVHQTSTNSYAEGTE